MIEKDAAYTIRKLHLQPNEKLRPVRGTSLTEKHYHYRQKQKDRTKRNSL